MTEATRKSRKKERRDIGGKIHLSVEASARFIGCCRSTFDGLLAKARKGKLKPALSWYRDTPRSPIWISEESLRKWAEERGRMHV